MGVLSCCQVNCNNIMCNTYVYGFGYICLSCQNNFKKYLMTRNISKTSHWTNDIILQYLQEFKYADLNFEEVDYSNIHEFFNEHTN